MPEYKVLVWGKRHTITVEKKSKTVWIADGDYMGESIHVEDRSAGTAVKRWREAATHRGK